VNVESMTLRLTSGVDIPLLTAAGGGVPAIERFGRARILRLSH
jgi:hypothetical protein